MSALTTKPKTSPPDDVYTGEESTTNICPVFAQRGRTISPSSECPTSAAKFATAKFAFNTSQFGTG